MLAWSRVPSPAGRTGGE